MNIETTDNSPLLQECIEELISSKIDEGKGRTAGNYRSAWNKLSTFLGPRVTEFTFADLTTDFLHHYLLWLMQGEDGKHIHENGEYPCMQEADRLRIPDYDTSVHNNIP